MKPQTMIGYLLGLVLLLIAPASWGVVVELTDPPAIVIPAGYTDTATTKAIKFALQQRKWQLLAEEVGEITAELAVHGRHQIRVSIKYDERYIRIRYLDSRNMYYQMGIPDSEEVDEWSDTTYKKVPLIHHRYNSWVKLLAKNIQKALRTTPVLN